MNNRKLAMEILEKYYRPQNKPLRVTLSDGQVLEGVFVGHYHDDPDESDGPPDAWHFIPENQPAPSAEVAGEGEITGIKLRNEEIKQVEFK